MSDYDFSGLTNPKRVIEKRVETANKTAAPESAMMPTLNQRAFLKGYSPEELAKQKAELAKILAKRAQP